MAVTPEVVTVSLIGEPQSGASRSLIQALERTLERNGAVHGESEDANFVLNAIDPDAPKPFRRKARGTFVAAIHERDGMPAQIEDSLKLEYPMLVRALANIVLCYVPGQGVWFTTMERGHYLVPENGDVDMLEPLVDAGPELDVFEAAGLGAEERLEELLAHDPQCAHAQAADGFTPLHFAAFFVHPGAARILLEAGADVNAVADNPMQVQPLHSAAAGGSHEIVRLLLERGADPNARQAAGGRPLDAARQNGDDELADLLIAHGATP